MKLGHLRGLTAACAIVLLGSVASWVSFRAQLTLGGMDPDQEAVLRQAMERAMQEALAINGWKGHVTLLGLTLPNWLVPITAVAATGLTWARATGARDTSPKIGVALAAYGVVHLLILLVVVLGNSAHAGIGAGALISLLGAIGVLGFTVLAALGGDGAHHHATPARRGAVVSVRGATAGYPTPNRPVGNYPAPVRPLGEDGHPTTLGRVQPTMDD